MDFNMEEQNNLVYTVLHETVEQVVDSFMDFQGMENSDKDTQLWDEKICHKSDETPQIRIRGQGSFKPVTLRPELI